MKIKYFGHSAVLLMGSKNVIIDPFLTGNPFYKEGSLTEKIDFVVITHDHGDHLGDGYEIAKKNNAVVIAQHEIAVEAQGKGLEAEGMNIGGGVERDGIVFYFTNAVHSSGIGHPMGAIIKMDGKTIYHAGDTGLFMDMQIIGDYFRPDLAFIPIGGRYTMDEEQAAYAVKKLLKVEKVIPIHYKTFPLIPGEPERFKELVGDAAEVIILQPGGVYEI